VQKNLSEELEYKFLKIKSGTLANSNPVIDKSDYLSLLPTWIMIHLIIVFPKKGWYFSETYSLLLSSDYTNTFNPFSIAKLILDLQQQF
jgi:NTE family protein